ncbi:MAG: alpha/beta hydrolase [Dehalococcoidia bacterium]
MPEIKNRNVSIYYEAHGEGRPLLLSHAYAASHKMWEPQVGPISERYRLITWDMRGHANSDSPEDEDEYSEERTVEDMGLILEAEGASEAVIGGLSLGGYMSFAFYLAHPDMVKGLLLVDTGPGYRNPDARAGWNKMAFAQADRYLERGIAGLPPATEVQVGAALQRSPEGLAKSARGMLAQSHSKVLDIIESITIPALVIVGADDTPFLQATEVMAAKLPNARKLVIEKAGHAANMDQPEIFNEAVLGFLDEVWAAG